MVGKQSEIRLLKTKWEARGSGITEQNSRSCQANNQLEVEGKHFFFFA